jgi:1,4-alpha-glucan branching enzyme
MGAIPYSGGVTFRVWAPFASHVFVAGTFNNWSKTANELSSELNGYWSTDIDQVPIGAQYKFVVTNRDHGWLLWKNDPYARELTNSSGNSIIADPGFSWTSGYQTPAWDEWVIYELHVGTFLFDAQSPGLGGNFQTVISKLPYLRDLGINIIEIMAAGEFPWDRSWGYNQSYMFAIEHSYGGPNGFRELVDAAHSVGIGIIFDVVYNHIGPTDLDMWQFDGWSQDSHGGIYFYNDWRRTTNWGDTRPDYGRPEVRSYLRDNALRWCEERQVDGLRWDATGWVRNVYGNNNDPANDIPDGWGLMQWINNEVHRHQPWKMTVAEDMHDNEWITKPTEQGGAGFNAQWAASFVHTIRAALTAQDDTSRDMYAVAQVLGQKFNGNALGRVVYTESHDEDANGHARLPEEIWPGNADSYFSKKRSTLGAGLIFTAPGIPMIFQGQEFLEDRYFDDRVQLDWSKEQRFSGILNLYRDLIHLRRNWFNNTRGLKGGSANIYHVNNTDKVIAFHRYKDGGPGDDVIVVANFGNRSYASYRIGMPRGGRWRVRFNSDWNGYSPDFGNNPGYDTFADDIPRDTLNYSANFGIGPYTLLILSQ